MRCVSLFSGCGGLDLGLANAGFRTVLGNDNSPVAAETFRANFPGVPFHEGSVSDLTEELINSLAGDEARRIDLLSGGPPCPPFSKSRFYRKEKPRALDDPVGDETLNGYLGVLKILRPRAFLLENVHGFAYGVHREALNYVIDVAEETGYTCTWRVLNAADYGVPQIRERFFLIGLLEGSFEFPQPTHAKAPGSSLFNGGLQPWATAGAAISDLDTVANADDAGHFAGGQYHDLLEQIPPGQNYLYFTKERAHPNPVFKWRSRYWSFLLKLSPDLPSWTIQARRSNNMGPFHWRNRILRIEEVKRLQTFPDGWYLAGKIEDQWRQVGNAVPPILAEALGQAIADRFVEGRLSA
jgi:DNA (cytosine-5)-methyltransferase 1